MNFSCPAALAVSLAIFTANSASAIFPLREGRWVKVAVDSTGVRRLPADTLSKWGFERPEDIRIFGFGSVRSAHSLGELPEEMPQVSLFRHNGDIYFFAEGDESVVPSADGSYEAHLNYYSSGSCYFVGEAPHINDLLISEAPIGETLPELPAVRTHMEIDVRRFEEKALSEGGVLFHSRPLNSGNRQVSFAASGVLGSPRMKFIAASGSPDAESVSLNIAKSDFSSQLQIPPVSSNLTFMEADSEWLTFPPEESGDSIIAVFSANNTPKSDYLGLREVVMIAEKENRIDASGHMDGWIRCTSPVDVIFRDAPADAVVWDVTDPDSIVSHPIFSASDGTKGITLHADGRDMRRIYSFSTSADLPTPELIGMTEVPLIEEIDPDTDLLIVTNDTFYEEGLRLAVAHENYQGLKTAVVRQKSVFDRYSSGKSHPAAIRRLLADIRPRYLCLFGASSRDPRNILAPPEAKIVEHLVGYEAENYQDCHDITTCHASDTYFARAYPGGVPGRLADSTDPTSYIVGRIPASDLAQARCYVDKAVSYLADPSKAGRYLQATILGSDGDSGEYLEDAENAASDLKDRIQGLTVDKIFPQFYPRSDRNDSPNEYPRKHLYESLAEGPRFYAYVGHGWWSSICNMNHRLCDEHRLRYGSMPVFFMATCRGFVIDSDDMSMGKAALFNPTGPIAVIAPMRESEPDRNIFLLRTFSRSFAAAKPGETWGEIWNRMLNSALSGSEPTRRCALGFAFCGDPALDAYAPSYRVTTTENTDTLVALSPVSVRGIIADNEGNTVEDFHGKVMLNIFSPGHERQAGDEPVKVDGRLTGTYVTEAKNGIWALDFHSPEFSREGPASLLFEAVDTLHRVTAVGHFKAYVSPSAIGDEIADTIAPYIRLRLDGNITETTFHHTPEFEISFSDDLSGISFNKEIPGRTPSIQIDGHILTGILPLKEVNSDGSIDLRFSHLPLAAGRHEITVTATDVAGNRARQKREFIIARQPLEATLSLPGSLLRDEATFSLIYGSDRPLTGRLLIRDTARRTRFSTIVDHFPFTWDFHVGSLSGPPDRIPDGTYSATYIFTDGESYGSTPEITFTVLHRE
ncbi:MAG: hypothetical protein K2K55_05585 [Duncaniella sp.]|nr:hypothetical protein [Duncaniella sp.]